ncbi:MAG TPA: diguanylate cyclase [Anaerolineales bacterium]
MPSKFIAANELNKMVSQQGLEPFLESTRVSVALLSSDGHLVSTNPAFEGLKQILPNANTFREIVASVARTEFDRLLQSVKLDHKAIQSDLDFGLESQPRRYTCLFVPLEDGRVLFFGEPVFTMFDLPEKYQRLIQNFERVNAELKETQRTLERKQIELKAVIAQADEVSHTDSLTLLSNRKQIIADLQRQVTFSDRYQEPLSISMLDFDHFKKVNDTYGHSAGDEVLRVIAVQLRDHVRSPDMIGRYGGEEFLVLLPNSTVKAASEQAERLCKLVRSTPIVSGENVIHITISIGIAQYRIHQENWQQLLDRSDQALYQAKRNGRDQWAVIES